MTITLTREEAQQVLDALDSDCNATRYGAIEDLRARLAQPEPPCKTGSQCIGGKCPQCAVREWQGLTDDEAKKTFEAHNCTISADLAGILARAIEAKLKEKNHG
jgi:hypothetical protein